MPPRRAPRISTASSAGSTSSASTAKTAESKSTRAGSASAINTRKGTRVSVANTANDEEDDSESDDEEVLKPKKGAKAAPARKAKKAIVESSDEDEDEMSLGKAKSKGKASKPIARVKAEPISEEEEEDSSSASESDEEVLRPSSSRSKVNNTSKSNKRVSTATAVDKKPVTSRAPPKATSLARAPAKKAVPAIQEEVQEDSESEDDSDEDEEVAQSLIIGTSSAKKLNGLPIAKVEEEDEGEGEQSDSDVDDAPASAQPRPVGAKAQEEDDDASSRASTPAPSTPAAEEQVEPAVAVAQPAEDDGDDLTASLAARPIMSKQPVIAPVEFTGPRKRLVIHKMALVDFKSYAGRQEIGPFHKSFSSIVGPNGSGKSNTIDALLFVFGFKATKMRQGKLSELIHNSEGREDLGSCSVEVWFREIIDLPGPDAYEVVPESTLVVARTAYRNNTSKYTINNRNSTFTEVTTLLKDRGIDLDHKRFLILQGEVESIAQMKPKAPNEHEDGLLEYLEDIIGTSRYKEPIQQCQEEVDKLNEERLEKTNRVKLVEREKSALEHAKKEADKYLKDQNELTNRQSELYQVYEMRYRENIKVASESVEKATKELQVERDSQAGIRQEVEELETEYKTLATDYKEIEKHTDVVSKELVGFEREEVQNQEKRKHLVTKQKKLKKSMQDDSHARSEASTSFKDYGENMDKLKTELEKHETNLAREEIELEKICDSLKDKTAVFSAQIDTKQAELQPWLDKVSGKQAAMDLAINQRNLLKEKAESVQKAIDEAEATMEKVQADNEEKVETTNQLRAEKEEIAQAVNQLKGELERLQIQDQKLRASATSARQKAEEARASQAASRSKGDVITSLTKLKDQGRLNGFHGRLGHLGRIDDKYDVAISTACPGLDNLVCDNVEAGQACLEHLRRNNLGRATILCLAALSQRNLAPIETPENAPRLFDLVTPKDKALAPAFYQVLQNTLVAKDLTQANRIAFGGQGGKRWRVVTLDGKLIDTSGTMSGGGNRVARGAMSSKIVDDEDVTPEAVARLERDTVKAEEALKSFSSDRQEKEKELAELQKKIPDLEMSLSKTEMAMRAGKKRVEEAEKRIQELKGQNSRPQADEMKKIASLEQQIEKLQGEHANLQRNVDKIQGEIKGLQNQILEVGGVRLRSQQAKVNGIKEMSEHANEQLTKAEVGKTKAEKDLAKLEKNIKMNAMALKELEEELAALEKSIRGKSAGLEHIRKQVEQAKGILEEKGEELGELKALLDEKQGDMNKFRARETELEQELEKVRRKLSENEKSLASVTAKLSKLELHEIDEDDDEEEEALAQAQANANAAGEGNDAAAAAEQDVKPKEKVNHDELRTLTEEELEELDPEQLKAQIALLEERIQRAKPNLSVLKEYRRREKEFLERAQDLERVTSARDAAKKSYDDLRKQRLEEFMAGFGVISMKLKEMYQMITLGGNAELELVDSLDPFSEGIIFSVMPPKKSWKNISNLSGGEKTLSSLALVFALHVFKPTPLYFMDEIDAALDFRNVSIVANYIQSSTKSAQFIIISLRNNMFELASRLVGIYKTNNCTKTISIDNSDISLIADSGAPGDKAAAARVAG